MGWFRTVPRCGAMRCSSMFVLNLSREFEIALTSTVDEHDLMINCLGFLLGFRASTQDRWTDGRTDRQTATPIRASDRVCKEG